MPAIKVLLPILKLFPLDYLSPANMDLVKGDLVIVPFKNKEITGIVWEMNILSSKTKLKIITRKLNEEFRLSENLISLITKTTNYYLSELGTIAKLVLPVEISEPPLKVKHQETSENFTLPPLSSDQNIALSTIRKCEKPTVLKGITGSGKTEIYFHLVDEFLRKGKQILIMLPEIALSQQIIKRFILRFGFEPIIWNSEISKSAKKMILRGIIGGSVKIVIGARSSLFLPYKDLGLIIIDEEHDSSYKQQEGVMYNARDMAILRGNIDNIKVVLCSATPSLETVYNCEIGKYQLIELKNRFNKAILPIIKIIDMKQENLLAGKWLSLELITSIRDTLLKGEQILLFLNRRGYCPLVLCKSCGYRFTCSSCSSWLVLHKLPKKLECHHCGFQEKIRDKCPECNGENSLTPCGPGIERIEEEVAQLFPNIRIALLSKDQVSTFKKGQELLLKMENNDIDILIGTQIVTKGYHFPNLTLVGVIDADLGLLGDDLRSAERTYQLLHQVGGRAGREHKPGQVLLQTYHPDNLVLNTLKYNAEEKFLKYELYHRESFGMPPFTKMASIIVVGKNEQRALEQAKKLVCVAPKNNVKILGPARGIMAKVAGKYRYRILIIADKKFNLQKYLTLWLSPINTSSSVQIKVDIDPQSFY